MILRASAVSLMLSVMSCSPGSGAGDEPAQHAVASSGGTPGGSAATLAGGGTGPIFGPISAPPSGHPDAPDGSCGATRVRGEQVVVPVEVAITETVPQPVALYFMLDQSGSMIDGNKWGAAVNSINAFASDPRSAGIRVALQMFSFNFLGSPPGCAACDGSDCRAPMVPFAVLPDAAAGLSAALNRVPIGLGTPIEAGLNGGIGFCRNHQQQTPGEKCIVVLITDGEPTACEEDPVALGGIAATAKGQDGVAVFTIGMAGADFSLMDAIARGAGTDCTPGAPGETCNAASKQDFLTALEAIRTAVVVTRIETRTETRHEPVPCEFAVPRPTTGDAFDPTKVNVEFGTGGASITVLKVGDASHCPGEGGWYYDDELSPSKVLVCPATCSAIQAAPDVNVSILLGCETESVIR